MLEHGVEQAGEVGVEALVARDELVGEGESGHLAALLEPEDGAEGAGEEDALDAGEADEALGERRSGVVDPLEGPGRLGADRRHGLDGVKETGLLDLVGDVGVDQERVGLGVDVLHHQL